MILKIYRHNRCIATKDCGNFEINLSHLEVVDRKLDGDVLKVWVE